MTYTIQKLLPAILACICIPAFADDTDSYLKQLDREIEKQEYYRNKKELQLDSLKTVLSKTTGYEERYDLNFQLFQAYNAYQLDSAFTYLKRAEVLAKQQKDSLRIVKAHLNFAPIFFHSGLYKQAIDLLSDWRQRSLHSPLELRMEYFWKCVDIYSSMVNNDIEPTNRDLHMRRLRSARDSLIHNLPDNWGLQAEKVVTHKEYDKALAIYHQHISDDSHDPMAALTFYGMARVYRLMGDTANQKKYLILSAINDMRQATREYRSLNELAQILYKEGDIDRASRYINRSLSDAIESSAGLRSMENSQIHDIIDKAYYAQQEKIKDLYKWLVLTAGLVMLLLTIGAWLLRRRNRQLNEMYAKLKESSTQLSAISEARRNYINNFIYLCQNYLFKMEDHRKALNKVAARRNFDELYETVKSTRYIDEEIDDFYALYDETFLQIYPDFIDNVNKLLRPEEQIVLEDGHKLNTELRMLTLLHHGITDSSVVAKFLRCSHSTVYNYRTKMRNRAIDRNTFEEEIAKMGEGKRAEKWGDLRD